MNPNWYEIWMKQNQLFFETANEYMGDIFSKNTFVNPEEHLKQIHLWLNQFKTQWESSHHQEEQPSYQHFLKTLSSLYQEASQLMLQQWIKRFREDQPVYTIKELYELWLHEFQKTYQQILQKPNNTPHFNEWMEAYFNYWR